MATVKAREGNALRRKANMKMAALGLVLALVSLPGTALGEAVTGYYIGDSAHSLRELGNWKDQIRPGRFNDSGVTNGFFGGTMVFDDQATGWGVQLYTTDMISVSNMIFRGGAVSKSFVIPEYYYLWFESGGRLEIEADSEKTLAFKNSACLKIRDVETAGEYVDIINHSTAHPLYLAGIGNTQTSTAQLKPEFRFSGEGDIVFSQNSSTPNGYNANGQGSAVVLVFNQTGTFKHEGKNDTYAQALIVPASDTTRRIELNAHGFWVLGYEEDSRTDTSDVALQIYSDTVITGPKGLVIGEYKWQPRHIYVGAGKTLTLDMNYLKTKYAGGTKGLWFKGGGTTVFTAVVTNTAEKVYIEGGATVKSPIIGAAWSETSPMGTNACISLANSGRFVYMGAGETTDRGFEIRYASTAYLEHAGTGPLVITGNFKTPNSGSSTLRLVNETDQDATYSGMLADNGSGKLAIVKQGNGLWRINCAATYTGTTRVDGGTLALGPSGSIAASGLTLQGSCLRIENAGASFGSLTLAANTANGLSVADGVSYTLPAFTRNDGATLDVTLGAGAELTMTGLADGKAPAWLTVNGQTGFIAEGKLKSIGDVSDVIDAKGGVIPDAPSAIVGITTATGSGTSVSLENAATTVTVVNQKQDVVDAEIALNAGETLTVAEVVVSEGAADLTVAARNGAATLAGPGGDPVTLNPAAGTAIGLAGDLVAPKVELKGQGTLKLGPDVSLTALTTAGAPTLETEPGSYRELGTWTNCNANVTYCGPGTLFVTNLCLGGAQAADSRLTVSGGTITNCAGTFKAGSGYLRVAGGKFVENGNGAQLYWTTSPSQITFELTEGTYHSRNGLVLGGWNTQVSFYLSGGQCTFGGGIEFPHWAAGLSYDDYTATGNRLNYILTVDGDGQLTMGTVTMGRIKYDETKYKNTANEWANPAMVNLNGGVCTVTMFKRDYLRSTSPSSRAFVNFNGGTLKTTNASAGPFGEPEAGYVSGSRGIDRVTVFSGGGTLDTNGKSVSTRMPFSAPYGKGVVSVPVPEAVAAATFVAPPTVAIIGDGEGASARVLFDPASGKVTGVQVLTPGWGYDQSVRARFNHGGTACVGESTPVLGPVAGGQLVKAGAGVYTFLCTNSVTDVKITEGAFRNGVDDVFTADTKLTLDGGNYDVNGYRQTFKSIAFGLAGGTIQNGTATADGLSIDFGEAVAGRSGVADLSHVAFSAQAKIALNGYDPAALESVNKIVLLGFAPGGAPASVPPLDDSVVLPRGWSLQISQTYLRLVRETGLTIIFR